MTDQYESFLQKRVLWLRRWTWLKIASIFYMGLFVFSLAVLQVRDDDQRERDRQEEIQNDYKNCLSGNDVRIQVRDLIVQAYSQGSTLDFTAVPGFEDMDIATQIYFENLTELLSSSDGDPEQLAEALAAVPLRDCEKEFPEAVH